tara:strand:- start:32499 stop:32996 length:498 start_codon:yes stop_codon:yes gene_type:complete
LSLPPWLHEEAPLVAQKLLGCKLLINNHSAVVTETEAYRGSDDPASHAFKGVTPRNAIMFDRPGLLYVYMIYGIHHCLNITCEPSGSPAAVLIRGLKLNNGIILDGPGKVCRHLDLKRSDTGRILNQTNCLQISDRIEIPAYKATPRIGIKAGQEKLWRYLVTKH